jgi:predicted HTH domain antitoxin
MESIDSQRGDEYNRERRQTRMSTNVLTIPYSDDLLLSMKRSPQEFEAEARLLLAVKLYELDRVSTGAAASLAGMSRVAFMFELARFGLSPLGQDPDELAEDLANA